MAESCSLSLTFVGAVHLGAPEDLYLGSLASFLSLLPPQPILVDEGQMTVRARKQLTVVDDHNPENVYCRIHENVVLDANIGDVLNRPYTNPMGCEESFGHKG